METGGDSRDEGGGDKSLDICRARMSPGHDSVMG